MVGLAPITSKSIFISIDYASKTYTYLKQFFWMQFYADNPNSFYFSLKHPKF